MQTSDFEYSFTDAAGNPVMRLQIKPGKVILHLCDGMDSEQRVIATNECKSLATMLRIPYTEQ